MRIQLKKPGETNHSADERPRTITQAINLNGDDWALVNVQKAALEVRRIFLYPTQKCVTSCVRQLARALHSYEMRDTKKNADSLNISMESLDTTAIHTHTCMHTNTAVRLHLFRKMSDRVDLQTLRLLN